MSDFSSLFFLCLAGIAFGCFFFGGLAFTLQWAARSAHPARIILSSYFLRLAITGGGIYFFSEMQWKKIAALLVGFLIARLMLLRFPLVERT